MSSFMRAIASILSACSAGRGSIYQPNTLTRAQLLQFNEELTRTYGRAYVSSLSGRAKQ